MTAQARKPRATKKPLMSPEKRLAIQKANLAASKRKQKAEREAVRSLTQDEFDQIYGREGEERQSDPDAARRQRKLAMFLVELPPEERAILSILRQGFVCETSGGFAHTDARDAEIHFAHCANLLDRRTCETSRAVAAAVLLEMARVLDANADAVRWIKRLAVGPPR